MKREKSLYHNIFHQINQIKEINQMHNSPHGIILPWGDKRGAHLQFARSARVIPMP
jgi:hypothetical protein